MPTHAYLAGSRNLYYLVVDVVDDQTVPGQVVALGQATWNAEGTLTTFTYGLDLAADT